MPDIEIANAHNQDLSPCPHCAASARILPDDRFRWVCGACGAPRVAVADPSVHSAAEQDHLKRAAKLTTEARVLGASATLTGLGATAFGLFGMLAAAAFHAGVVLPLVLLGLSLGLSIVTIALGISGRRNIERAKAAVSSAWECVAEALMRKHQRAITALDLAAMLKVDEGEAERILTLLSVEDRVHSVVTDEAQIRYSIPGQLRVDVDNPLSNPADPAVRRELEEEREQRASAATVMAPIPKVDSK